MFKTLLLFSLSAATITFASDSDEDDLQARLVGKELHYGTTALNNDRRRTELIKKIAYTCNLTPCDPYSFDYSKSRCFTPSGTYCSLRRYPREEYFNALDEIFYPIAARKKSENYGNKCCLAALRSGCNLCTCAGYLAPCAVSSSLILCGLVCTEIVTTPNYDCQNTCTNPNIYNLAREATLATLGIVTCTFPSCGVLPLLSGCCVSCLSNPANWGESPETPGDIQIAGDDI